MTKSKAEKKQPWFKFYPSDWRGDANLHACSIAARGLWADMMCTMHTADPYGHMAANGHPLSIAQIARLSGIKEKEALKYLAELERNGVYSRTDDAKKIIYSRRMVRDREKAEFDKSNGGRGGNPRLMAGDNGGVNPPNNGYDKAQKPETTSKNQNQKNERGSSPSKHVDDFSEENSILIAEDYAPGPRAVEYAYSLGMKKEDLDSETRKFVARAAGRPPKGASADMDFKFWCDRWLEFKNKSNPPTSVPDQVASAEMLNKVFVIRGTPGWNSWVDHIRRTRKGLVWSKTVERRDDANRIQEGWWWVTEFAPGYDEATGERLPPKETEDAT